MKIKPNILKLVLLTLLVALNCNLFFNAINGVSYSCECEIELVQEKECEEDYETKIIDKDFDKDKTNVNINNGSLNRFVLASQFNSIYLSITPIVHLDIELRPPLT